MVPEPIALAQCRCLVDPAKGNQTRIGSHNISALLQAETNMDSPATIHNAAILEADDGRACYSSIKQQVSQTSE